MIERQTQDEFNTDLADAYLASAGINRGPRLLLGCSIFAPVSAIFIAIIAYTPGEHTAPATWPRVNYGLLFLLLLLLVAHYGCVVVGILGGIYGLLKRSRSVGSPRVAALCLGLALFGAAILPTARFIVQWWPRYLR